MANEKEREGGCRGEVLETERDVTTNLRCAAHPDTERNVNTQNLVPLPQLHDKSPQSSTNNSIVPRSVGRLKRTGDGKAVALHAPSLQIWHLKVHADLFHNLNRLSLRLVRFQAILGHSSPFTLSTSDFHISAVSTVMSILSFSHILVGNLFF
jgi:hypothetical protein